MSRCFLIAGLTLSLGCCANRSEPTTSEQKRRSEIAMPSDDMVAVEAGWFRSGCAALPESASSSNAGTCIFRNPPRALWLSSFEIDRFETSRAAYAACVDARVCTPSRAHMRGDPRAPDLPILVRYEQAATYCSWRGRRLPTEAQWEKAARGTDGRMYPWGNATPDCASAALSGDAFDEDSKFDSQLRCDTAWPGPIGTHRQDRSPYGALDMAGNAAEWTTDDWIAHKGTWATWDHEKHARGVVEFADPETIDPTGPTEEQHGSQPLEDRRIAIRVVRGGVHDAAIGTRRVAIETEPPHGASDEPIDLRMPGEQVAGVRCIRRVDGPPPPPRSERPERRYEVSLMYDTTTKRYEIKSTLLPGP